jgi:hypothetical protein
MAGSAAGRTALPLSFYKHGEIRISGSGLAGKLRGDSLELHLRHGVFRMQWEGADRKSRSELLGAPRGVINYLVGVDRTRWKKSISSYSRAKFLDIYSGISVEYYERKGQMEYDLSVAPNCNPQQIALSFPDASRVVTDRGGDLVIESSSGIVRHRKPVAYQMENGHRRIVEASYAIQGRRVTFQLGRYDRSKTLVIDPVVEYATYLGGSGQDSATHVTSDAAGNFYLAGVTASPDFALTMKAPAQGRDDVFIAKFNSDFELVYCTIFGSLGDERVMGWASTAIMQFSWVTRFNHLDFPSLLER